MSPPATIHYPIELFQCGHSVAIAPSPHHHHRHSPPPPPPHPPRTGRRPPSSAGYGAIVGRGEMVSKQEEEEEEAFELALSDPLGAMRTAGGGGVGVEERAGRSRGLKGMSDSSGSSSSRTRKKSTATASAAETTVGTAERKSRRRGVVLEDLVWPFVAVAEGLAEVRWDVEVEAAGEAGWSPFFVFVMGACPREGCRGGGGEGGWEGAGVYDEDDVRDLADLWESVRAMEQEAVVAAWGLGGDVMRTPLEKRAQTAGSGGDERCWMGKASTSLRSHLIEIIPVHREEPRRLHGGVGESKRSNRAYRGRGVFLNLHRHPRVTGKTERQEPLEVVAQKQLPQSLLQPRVHTICSASRVASRPVLLQLLMMRMCLEQAEMLAAMQAPKGWFEACLRHVLEGWNDLEGTVLAH
ncbi:uncharacterized protein BKCO1_19000153 [Diplodia corticola]|uniref:Uncharacterized protein n=1 Tax=Diplodia corticola TaxID=236234 RepID=A0A1J9R312_9PEZI|nr:uncharacterized protein BKCO1_19000153 [Diplodia corticola]OJD35000.1 hypothetical protein BKCO1_19000153 [Diplodia corticola]